MKFLQVALISATRERKIKGKLIYVNGPTNGKAIPVSSFKAAAN